MSSKKHLTVGLPWHSINSSNLGLGALTECQLDLVQRAADELGVDVRFEVLFWPDRTDAYVERDNLDFRAFGRSFLLSPRSGLAAYARRCDLVLDIAGGDSFTDQYGSRRFVFQSITKAAVIQSGTPLVLSPQTFGPFERPWARRAARWILRRAHAVVSRDVLSSDLARDMGAGERLLEATDVAFRLPYDRPPGGASGKIRFGVNVSGLLFRGGYDRSNYFGLQVDYVRLIRELLRRLTSLPDVEVHLIGHVLVPLRFESVDDDLRVAMALGEEFPGTVVAPEFRTPSEAKSYIAGMDLFTGSRMHACIAAFSSGVPVVPLAYSRKFKGLFSTLGYPLVADCLSETEEQILAKVDAAIRDREALAASIERCNREAHSRLDRYDDLIRSCLAKAAGLEPVAERHGGT